MQLSYLLEQNIIFRPHECIGVYQSIYSQEVSDWQRPSVYFLAYQRKHIQNGEVPESISPLIPTVVPVPLSPLLVPTASEEEQETINPVLNHNRVFGAAQVLLKPPAWRALIKQMSGCLSGAASRLIPAEAVVRLCEKSF